MKRRKIDARLQRLEQQASRRRAKAEPSSPLLYLTLAERWEKILTILREIGPAKEVAALEALPAQELVLVERTGAENAPTRIHLGVSVLRTLRTSAWARMSR